MIELQNTVDMKLNGRINVQCTESLHIHSFNMSTLTPTSEVKEILLQVLGTTLVRMVKRLNNFSPSLQFIQSHSYPSTAASQIDPMEKIVADSDLRSHYQNTPHRAKTSVLVPGYRSSDASYS